MALEGTRSPSRQTLKRTQLWTDLWVMADLECPICNADVPLNGDERPGEEVFCTYCGCPLQLKGQGDDLAEMELEEDF